MKQTFFESPQINETFKQELHELVLREYKKAQKPWFNWHVILPITTSVALVAVLMVQINPSKVTQESTLVFSDQTSESTLPSKVDEPVSLETLDKDLDEIEQLLLSDEDLDLAIEFEEI